MRPSATKLLPVLLASFAMPGAAPALAADLAAHRAVYALSPETLKSGDVVGADGKMTFEIIDACDGWAVHQRLDLTVTNREGQAVQTASDYVTWESKDGHEFRFHLRQTTETAVSAENEGTATIGPAGGEAKYSKPSDETKALPAGTLFPTAHTNAIIEAARAGRKFDQITLFDGTSDTGPQDTSITLLDWEKPDAAVKWPALAALPSTRTHVAFFDRKEDESTPSFEEGVRYWENGVGDDLRMDFGQFVMHGTMTEFTPLPHKC